MSLGEQIVMRIAIILLLTAIIYGFRLMIALLKKGWNSLTNPGGKAQTKAEAAQRPKAVQPPKPPVIPNQPVTPPVIPSQPPVNSQRQPISSQPAPGKPQQYKGTVPLDPGNGFSGGFGFQQTPVSVNYCVQGVNGPFAGRRMMIPSGGCTVGRNHGCTIQFPPQTPGVSGNHCKVDLVQMSGIPATNIYLMDNNSTYGTYLENGQRLAPGMRHPLRAGEKFFLGSPSGPGFVLEVQS